jgi:tetratricopeptide (TPR) repeat protein
MKIRSEISKKKRLVIILLYSGFAVFLFLLLLSIRYEKLTYISFGGLAIILLAWVYTFYGIKCPRDPEAYLNRGITYGEKGQLDQAILDFTKALEINSRFGDAYYNRGLAYNKKGRYDLAISDLNKALEINPGLAEAYNSRGYAYQNKAQYDQAISDLNKALELNPNLAYAYYNRAIAYCFKKEYEKSWKDVERAQSLSYQIPGKFLELLRNASGRLN